MITEMDKAKALQLLREALAGITDHTATREQHWHNVGTAHSKIANAATLLGLPEIELELFASLCSDKTQEVA